MFKDRSPIKVLVKAIAILIIATISACASSSTSTVKTNGLVNVAEITENPESYIGRSVLVRNDILEIIGERGFILDKDRAFSGDTILAIDTTKMLSSLSAKNTPEVLVRGRVERLILANFPQQYGLNLDSDLYGKYENQPVIITESLILSPDPEDLTQHPEVYYGKPLAIKGELEDLTSYGIFELDEKQVFGGEDLIVVQPKPRIKLNEGQMAIVYGTLRPFIIAELERDYDLAWDLSIQQQIEAEYSQKPVFVADKIQLLKSRSW